MIDAVGSEAAYDELLTKSHGNRCLIILEGLDEISADWQQNDETFSKLVHDINFLSYANIIITSRPHACIHLSKNKKTTRTIEIVGFGKTRIKEYAEMYFNSKCESNTVDNLNTAERFIEQVYSDPHISSLCYVPICLEMVLECFEHSDKILYKTFTELYQSFVVSRINYHIHHKKAMPLGTIQESDKQCYSSLDNVLSDVPELLEGTLETIFLLSKLAYNSYFEWYEHLNNNKKTPKIVYAKKYLTHCNIKILENDACGLLKATNTLYSTGNTVVYTFNHLSVQEYFCALHISLLPEDQQLQLLKDHLLTFPYIWPFYAGITKLRSSNVSHYFHQYILQDNQLQKPIQLEKNPTFTDCRNVMKNCDISDQQTMTVLNSIHEAQLSSDVYKHEAYAVFMLQYRFRLYDYRCISHFMSTAPITQLYLLLCDIGDQEVDILAKCKYMVPSLKVLDLNDNNVTHKGIEYLIPIINNLTHLSVAHNPVGDKGIQLFSKPPLKFSSLIQLDIRCIGMTVAGTYYGLSEYLLHNNSLQSLEVSNNNIEDHGLFFILFRKIANPMSYKDGSLNTSLVRLSIKKCEFNLLSIMGQFVIALLCYKTLKYLEISENSIKDIGINYLSNFLEHKLIALVQLSAHSCGFHSTGGESIAEMLQVNKTLKYLNISNNDIGDDGIAAITHSVEVNTTLVQLKIYDCSYGCKGLEAVNKMLKVNKTLKELCISVRVEEKNCTYKVASTVVETFLGDDCTLAQLNVCSRYRWIRDNEGKLKFEMSSTANISATNCTVNIGTIRPYGTGQIFRYAFKVYVATR